MCSRRTRLLIAVQGAAVSKIYTESLTIPNHRKVIIHSDRPSPEDGILSSYGGMAQVMRETHQYSAVAWTVPVKRVIENLKPMPARGKDRWGETGRFVPTT